MASYYEYHLERANSHFRDNGAIRNNHVRACRGRRNGDAAKTSLACIAPIALARMHFHPALMCESSVFPFEHNALETGVVSDRQ